MCFQQGPCHVGGSIVLVVAVVFGGVFIAGTLLLLGFMPHLLLVKPVRQGVKCLCTIALCDPVLLAGAGGVLGVKHHALLMCDGVIKLQEKSRIVAPRRRVYPVFRGSYESFAVLAAVLEQQLQLFFTGMLTRDQLAKLAGGFIDACVREFLQGVNRILVRHGRGSLTPANFCAVKRC